MKDWLTPGAVLAIGLVYFIFVMLPVMISDLQAVR